MMLQIFGSGEKHAGRSKKSPPEIDVSTVGDDADSGDDISLRLERELAVVLARKPRHRSLAHELATDEDDGETPLVLSSGEVGVSIERKSTTTSTEPEGARAAESGETATSTHDGEMPRANPSTSDQWMKSTRINRRSALFRKSASIAITFAVTAFIISVVAMILFGLPDGKTKFTASSDRAALIKTRTVGIVPVKASTTPASMRLGLK